MTREAYREVRRQYWQRLMSHPSQSHRLEEKLDEDAWAADALAQAVGVAWDEPAPRPLPEKISWRDDVNSPTGFSVLTHSDGEDFCTVEEEAVYPEVVRRYNAYPAIRAWAESKHGGPLEPFWEGLYKLLDGPHGQPPSKAPPRPADPFCQARLPDWPAIDTQAAEFEALKAKTKAAFDLYAMVEQEEAPWDLEEILSHTFCCDCTGKATIKAWNWLRGQAGLPPSPENGHWPGPESSGAAS